MMMSNNKDKKKVLGRGLGALLESPETDITAKDISGNYVAGAIASVRLEQIEENPFQPREDFVESDLEELTQSIREQGIIQPVTARKMGYDKYQLISGERRLRAAKRAGLTEIPAYIRIANDQQMLEMALVENIQRKNLNALEVALAYQRLIDECKISQEEVSKTVGKDRSTISNYLRLLKLPPEIQVAIRDGAITMGHARALIGIEDETQQKALLHQILSEQLSVRDIEMLARETPGRFGPDHTTVKKQPLPEALNVLQAGLRDKFGARIQFKRSNKGNGSIVIPFKSDHDLSRIIDLLNK